MHINVGSLNQTKITAVKETLQLYPKLFPNPDIVGIAVTVPEFGHPQNIKDTVAGAIERATQAFHDCEYSIGLEGGLIEVPFTTTGYLETGACAIYDGHQYYLGLGPAFEWPQEVTKFIVTNKGDASQAFKQLGYTKEEKLGVTQGGILAVLTNNRMTREDLTKYSLMMSLIRIEQARLFD